jgi:hypothetical protein
MKIRKTKTQQYQWFEKSKNVYVALTEKIKLKKAILDAYIAEKICRATALHRLNIKIRQFKRIVKKYKTFGVIGLLHGLSHKASNNKISEDFIKNVIHVYTTKYHDFSYIFASEKLLELDNITVSPSSLRNWLLKAGITRPKHKHKTYHKLRERRHKFGELLQLDGSIHDWFENEQVACLMNFVDDATSTTFGLLFDGETTNAAMHLLYQWCIKYGVPEAIYADLDSVYKINDKHIVTTIEEELSGQKNPLTKFAKVCNRLGIKLIYAHSPQAKGRVERNHGTYQDRFIKEMRLRGIKTIETANQYLQSPDGYLERINKKFAKTPKDDKSACIAISQADLYNAVTIDFSRTVRNNYTVQCNNIIYQLSRTAVVNAGAKVVIKQYLHGEILIFAERTRLDYEIVTHIQKSEAVKKHTVIKNKKNEHQKLQTPWRRFNPGFLSSTKNSQHKHKTIF